MPRNWQKSIKLLSLFEAAKKFSQNCSLHGLVYLFTRRNFRAKQFWIIAITFTFIVCVYNLILTGKEHFITKPTVTTLSYNSRKTVKFPPVVVCHKLSSHSFAVNSIMRQNKSAALQAFTGYLHYNPIYSDVRKLLSENLTEAFSKYPQLENSFRLMLANFDHELGAANYYRRKYQNWTLEEILRGHLELPSETTNFENDLTGSYTAVFDENIVICQWKGM